MHLILWWVLACTPRPDLSPVASTPATLGWKLVPGQELTYKLHTRLTGATERIIREEHWTYRVDSVDSAGMARLSGRLTAFGVARTDSTGSPSAVDIEPAQEIERERLAQQVVVLYLSAEGRLARIDGLELHDSLPHRLLSLKLPNRAILPGEDWADPALARPYANLLPAETVVSVEGYQTYKGLYRYQGDVQALLESRGEVTAATEQGRSSIALKGSTWWDPDPGVLAWRSLEGELVQSDQAQVGHIQIQIELLDVGLTD
ncbi:MAG: hypothetical protein VX519_08935 [Myxococcota bacterium]|nr:hypothetical protein [Myxococcota bacterium]